jgi:hypothetical protein
MRNRVILTGLVVAVFLAAWWLISNRPDVPPKRAAVSMPAEAKTEPSSTPPASEPPPPIRSPAPVSFEARQRAFIAAFKKPISFYGKVIDQHGDPVAGARVTFSANDDPMARTSSEYVRTSDSDGLFSIDQIVGFSLAVAVSKAGYKGIAQNDSRIVTSSGVFDYGIESASAPRLPDKNAPAIFRLHKIGIVEPLVKISEKNFRMARDGTPLLIAVDKEGAHQVLLRCWNQELRRPAGQQQYDWKLEVSVPNGGLFPRRDAFAFEAPQDGYAASDVIDMPMSLPYQEWDSFAARSYFIRFGDGTFARINLRMRAGGDHFVVWESFFNPKAGSPNLNSP